jgi:hypothetical protein
MIARFGVEADLGVTEEALEVDDLAAVVDQLDHREEDEARGEGTGLDSARCGLRSVFASPVLGS